MNYISVISKINNNIYLSGLEIILKHPEILIREGIKNIVVCIDMNTIEILNTKYGYLFPDLNILFVPMDDTTSQNLWKENKGDIFTNNGVPQKYYGKSYIEIVYNFIENAINRSEKILVHCYAGMSRSASMLIYYFMKKEGIDYHTSKKIIKKIRPIIEPNVYFKHQLQEYDFFREKYIQFKFR